MLSRRPRSRHPKGGASAILFALAVAGLPVARAQPTSVLEPVTSVRQGLTAAVVSPPSPVGALLKRSNESDPWRYVCGATLIAPTVAVTAAHCLPSSNVILVELAFSVAPDVTLEPAAWSQVSAFVVHHLFSPLPAANARDLHDLALIRLAEPVAGGIAELAQLDELRAETTITVTAYGPQTVNGPSGIRRTGLVRVGAATSSEVVVDTGLGTALCQGDSGGGAFDLVDGRLMGVVSRGVHLGWTCDTETVLTRLVPHHPWIEEQLAQFEHPQPAQAGAGAACSAAGGNPEAATWAWFGAVAAAINLWRRFRRPGSSH